MNKIKEVIQSNETDAYSFHPKKAFYERIGINRKRFGLLLRNEKEATINELQRLAVFFGTSLNELIDETISN